jgi:hypothetical protein
MYSSSTRSATDISFREFRDDKIPPYIILSYSESLLLLLPEPLGRLAALALSSRAQFLTPLNTSQFNHPLDGLLTTIYVCASVTILSNLPLYIHKMPVEIYILTS